MFYFITLVLIFYGQVLLHLLNNVILILITSLSFYFQSIFQTKEDFQQIIRQKNLKIM